MTPTQPRVHDLIRFAAGGVADALPAWVTRDHGDVWAVVRRQQASRTGAVAAGVRGRRRVEREAIEVDRGALLAIATPESLAAVDASALPHPGIVAALRAISGSAAFAAQAWGPTGSTGFQLATGLPAVHVDSDLDLVVRADAPLPRDAARPLLDVLTGLPCRADCLIETAAGAVALAEWAASRDGDPVLLRTASGPRLTTDPWATAPLVPA